ncbi:N-6 DNA methylase [Streptomyces scabiei]|uniref:site-specific DNA-methyltransferase (adenine-specific) n=1 Tax=Streptomyces scabiei TaxID=1930 RepID=A0A100JWT2_STRSC|nr:N-6 DNA methylase [Streptomyces scabiei]GAQ67135.1 putative type I restriction enzymeP M protein [Streptomyces scabiei]
MSLAAATEAITRLASRDASRTEADLQADVYIVLTSGALKLTGGEVARLEVPTNDGTRRRLDIEIGNCVIEVKKDLRVAGIRKEAELQLAGYVATQTQRLGTRYVGILTDGTDWHLYRLHSGSIAQVTSHSVNPADPNSEGLISWLEAILTTQTSIKPTPQEIKQRLGANSPAYLLDHATLKGLYDDASSVPEVRLKRNLWAKLLRTAFGKAFSDDENLFVDHTLLVLTAEMVAHAVVGFDISRASELTPASITRGTAFSSSQIYGVVESDFFDWVLHAPGGEEFIASLSERLARFDWGNVEHDVLKALYESVISTESRTSLGEYYTPDWLADRVVQSTVTNPLNQTVLDPSCGSGTFIFHAVRNYLDAAEESGMSNAAAVASVTQHVYGMDVHPVAVALARVTYLLAIGTQRLRAEDRGAISVPVYLGDSLQWEQRRDLFGGEDTVTITTTGDDLVDAGGGALFGDDLVFPRKVLHDAGDFDRLVTAMADKALDHSKKPSRDLIRPVLRQFGIHPDDEQCLTATFDVMRRLDESGRDHIWGYYVRNLIRPLWLSEKEHKVDVLIGNPPWLRYSKMTKPMQDRYKVLAKERGLLSGKLGASGRDLSTLFVTRSVELYLRPFGQFAFVMPHGTLTRKPHEGFRSGKWHSHNAGDFTVQFKTPWDLSKAPTGFPNVSCVIHGNYTKNEAKRMPTEVEIWSSKAQTPNLTWKEIQNKIEITQGKVIALDPSELPPASPYKRRFRQGAVLAPRVLLFVNEEAAGPLGPGAGRVKVSSRRTTIENPAWKVVPSLSATVERAFVRKVHLGETLVPFRVLEPLRAVLPVTDREILPQGKIEENPGLASWWEEAEAKWARHKSESDKSALLDRIDYHNQLSSQLPAARHRVLYTASGKMLAAARVEDPNVVVEHILYWAAASSVDEARYLTAILNSKTVLDRVAPLQAIGLFGARHFDKIVFEVPIPSYDSGDADHEELAQLAGQAEEVAAGIDLSAAKSFKTARSVIRKELIQSGISGSIESVVARIIPASVLPTELRD